MLRCANIYHKAAHQVSLRLGGVASHGGCPRRTRRGYMLPVAALGLTIWAFTLSLSYQRLFQETRQARAEALATLIADLAADFDLYVHQNQIQLASLLAATPSNARALATTDLSTFIAGGAAGSWRMPIAGLNRPAGSNVLALPYLDLTVAIARADATNLPIGLIVLEARSDAPHHLLSDLTAALTKRSADADRHGIGDPHVYGAELLGRALTSDEFILATPRYSGLNPALVLREARVGHDLLTQMETSLDFANTPGGSTHDLTNLGNLQTDSMIASNAGCLGGGRTCSAASETLITQSSSLDSLTVTEALNINGASTSSTAGFEAVTLTTQAALTSVEVLTQNTSNTGQITASGPLTATTAQATTATMAEFAATQAAVAKSDAASAAPAARLSVPQATIPTLSAEITRTTRAHIGQGATRLTPAPLSTGQLAAVTAQFGTITTSGGCQGC